MGEGPEVRGQCQVPFQLLCTLFSEIDSDLELNAVYTAWLADLSDPPVYASPG